MNRLLPVLKWLGFGLTLAALGVALAWAADIMRPIRTGDAEEFWAVVLAAGPGSGPEDDALAGEAYTWCEPYVYECSSRNVIHMHGVPLKQVHEQEVMALFPAVLDRIVEHPSDGLRGGQIKALLGHDAPGVTEGLAEVARHREEIGTSVDCMQAFVAASSAAQLERLLSEAGTWYLSAHMSTEREVGVVLDRANRYWANVAFEAVFLAGVAVWIWLPLLSRRVRVLLPLFWGITPLLVLGPYFLGYCNGTFTSLGPLQGGALYPWVLAAYSPLHETATDWDIDVLNAIPRILEPLTQHPFSVLSMSGGAVGPTAPAAISLALAALLYAARRAARAVKRRNPPGKAGG